MPVAPAAALTASEVESAADVTEPVTSRLSWKAPFVTIVFDTPSVRVAAAAPTRRWPKASAVVA